MKKNRKNSTKSLLACAVLASVLGVTLGNGVARAADASVADVVVDKDHKTPEGLNFDEAKELYYTSFGNSFYVDLKGFSKYDGYSWSMRGYYEDGGTLTFGNGEAINLYTMMNSSKNNTLNLTIGWVKAQNAYGGYNIPCGNKVIVDIPDTGKKSSIGNIYGNSADGFYWCTDNTVEIRSSCATLTVGNIIGSYAHIYNQYREQGGTFSANKVYLDSPNLTVTGSVVGGQVVNEYENYTYSDIVGNEVNMTAGTVEGNITGGAGDEGNAFENKVTISGGKVKGNVTGGYMQHKTNVYDNVVTIGNNAAVGGNVIGGYCHFGGVYNNVVTIGNNATVGGDVGGAWTGGDGRSYNNKVYIYGGTVSKNAYGGWGGRDGVSGNELYMEGGTVKGNVYGGGVNGNDTGGANVAENNLIDLKDNFTVNGSVFGGYGDILSPIHLHNIGTWFYPTNAKKNIVIMKDGSVSGSVYGGQANYTDDNQVTLTNVIVTENVFGGNSPYGHSKTNTVNLYNSKAKQVFGGYCAQYDICSNNTVGLVDNSTAEIVYGGYAIDKSSASNTVYINGSTVTNSVYGCWSNNDSGYSTVNILNAVSVRDVYGGWSTNTQSYHNTVDIGGASTVNGMVYGSKSQNGTAHDNIINITYGTLNSTIFGGYSTASNSFNNTVNISCEPQIKDSVYGGYSDHGKTYKNTVNIDMLAGGQVDKDIYGGDSGNEAYDNVVKVTAGKICGNVYGGYTVSNVAKSYNNKISVSGGTIASAYAGYSVYGAAYNNTVDISGGTATSGYGGNSKYGGAVYNNTVNVSGGTVASVYGGRSNTNDSHDNVVNISNGNITSEVYGGGNTTGKAYNNTINISGGTVSGYIYGGRSDSNTVSGNTINISGGDLSSANIYGGFTSSGQSQNNTVNLLGNVTAANIHGGSALSTGNELNVYKSGNIVTGTVDNFTKINFFVPETSPAYAMLKVGTINFADAGNAIVYLDAMPTYNISLLTYNISNITGNLKYNIGGNVYNVDDEINNSILKENGHLTVINGAKFVKDEGGGETTIKWEIGSNSFFAGIYYDAAGTPTAAEDNKAVLSSAPAGITKVYGSYSENAGQTAENGIVELAGKVTSTTLDLIGGYNSAEGTNVGSNTLNVLGTAVGSSVKSVDKFDTINFFAPASGTADPLLHAGTINFNNATINLDVIPTSTLTLLSWDDASGTVSSYIIAGVAANLNQEYSKVAKDEANHRVTAATGKLTFDDGGDKSIKWTVTDNAFCTGIYYPGPSSGLSEPIAVTDNKVILNAETAQGVNKVYGSYSAKGDVKAENGTVELAGKITATTLDLIGGNNSVESTNVGSNTLNILADAAESSVNSVTKFTKIKFEMPDTAPAGGTILTVATADLTNTEINFSEVPIFSVKLLEASSSLTADSTTTYKVGERELTVGKTYSRMLEEKYRYIVAAQGLLNVSTTAIELNINKFLAATYTDGNKNTINNNEQKTIFMDAAFATLLDSDVTQIYGSYSNHADVKAEGGTLDLFAKQTLTNIELIGGYNSENAANIGTNTLNVGKDAAESSAKSISAFSDINFSVPSTAPTTALLSVETADVSGTKITLDRLPTFDLKLIDSDSCITGYDTASYKIGDEEVAINSEYGQVTALGNRVEVAKGMLKYDATDKCIMWDDLGESFYTGIYYSAVSGKEPVAAAENTVMLHEKPADGISKIYGSYSASASQAATGGTVELTGKIIGASDAATDVELIGGYNSAGGSVGSNTLNVSGAAAGSKIKAVSAFDTINFSLPDTEATTLLTATGTVDIDGAKITLDKAPAYSLTLLDAGTLSGTAASYWIGTEDVTSKTSGNPYHNVIADSSNQRIEVTSGWFAKDSIKLTWNVAENNSFYTGIYYPSGGGEAVHAEDNKVVLNTTPNVKYVYGSYSEDASKAAENGTVELAGKITSADLNLIGGKNSAESTNVGNNTLSVKAAATGSTVYNIQGFKEIDFVVPETATDPILQANHINGLVADKIKLDKAPTCDLTILKVDILEIEKIGTQFFFGDTDVSAFTSSGNEYHAATANNAKYRVEVTSGYWNNTNTTIAWKNTEAFYTGIYTDSTGNVTKVTDNIVQLDSVPQDGVTKVYGSYSAKNDVAATGGTVALAGKIIGTSDAVANVELIGGYNFAGSSVGNNTLSILASAAESKVNKIENFTELDFYVPDKVISGAMLTATTADNIAGAKIWLEAAPAFDMTLLTAGNDITTGTTYWIGDTQLTVGDPNKYPYFNVANNTTNILVSKGYIDTTTATAIKWTNEDSILTGKYTDEDGNTASAADGTVVINNNLNIPAGVTKIYGSYSAKNEVEATGGTVALADGIANSTLELIGGYNSAGGTFSDNTLKVLANAFRSKVKSISAFDKIDFTLPQGIKNGDTVLNTTNITYNDATIDVSAATGVKLNKDDVIYLVKSETAPTDAIGNDGAAVLGGAATVSINGNDLILTLLQDFEQKKSAGSEDQQKAPVEGMAAAVQTVNMSADLASGEGMASLVANTAGGTTDTFGAMSAGSSKYKTGSHVDVDGWGVIVGAGKTKDWKDGSATTYGLFFEYGKGDFDTYNGNVHGDGNSENKGVGIMIRHQLANNTYFEGNIRYGKQETEWSESELGGYETDSKYHGAMVGFGKIYKKGNNKLDTYLRYAYGHVGACDATLKDSEYHFESVKSHRVRTGVRYTFGQQEKGFKPYIGAAWEHEFNGEAKASISGIGEAPAPTLQGNTGIFELGFDWDADTKWVFGMNANAYIGKRKGWDGMARVFYNF